MSYIKGINEYRRQTVTSASPLDLVIMVYDGAIRSCQLAKGAIESGDLNDQHKHLIRAQQFLTELTASLDMQRGGVVAQNLFGIYAYCLNLLADANISDRVQPIDETIKLLEELRDAWRQIRDQEGVPNAVK